MTGMLVPLVTGAEVTFWVCAPLMVLGAAGLVFFRKAVYSILSMAFVMINLAVIYASLDAAFLFAVQIIVYTGAILMLFLFVMMLVGVDTTDSVVETIKGQRWLAVLAGAGLLGLLVFGVGGTIRQQSVGLEKANAAYGGNVESLAALIFGRYVFAFELTSALLITAAVGAMILAHQTRLSPKAGQKELAAQRMAAYSESGTHPGSLPNSGVFATFNSIATPSLLPDGSISPASVSKTLAARGVIIDTTDLHARTTSTFAAIENVRDEEESE